MATKKQEVAEIKDNAVAVVADFTPEWMKDMAGQGVEEVDVSDLEIPRLQLLQSLSPEVVDGDEKPGVFYHSVLEEELGKDVLIIPVYTDVRYILWRPRHDGGGILARSDDGKHWSPPNATFTVKPDKNSDRTVTWETKPTVQESGLDKWGSYDPNNENSQPAATKMYNIVAYLPDHPELSPCVITLQRGAVRVAKKLMGKLKLATAPSFGQVYRMTSIKDNSGEGDFFNYKFDKVGYVQDEELFNNLKDMYENFREMGVNIRDVESLGDEPQSDDIDVAIDI